VLDDEANALVLLAGLSLPAAAKSSTWTAVTPGAHEPKEGIACSAWQLTTAMSWPW
jgi:hypothetical protein